MASLEKTGIWEPRHEPILNANGVSVPTILDTIELYKSAGHPDRHVLNLLTYLEPLLHVSLDRELRCLGSECQLPFFVHQKRHRFG